MRWGQGGDQPHMESSRHSGLNKALTAWGFALGSAAFVGWLVHLLLPAQSTVTSEIIAIATALAVFIYVGSILHLKLDRPTDDLSRPRFILFKAQGRGIFLTTPATWLYYRAKYTVFVNENDGFERLLCIVEVLNIQDDKKIQLAVINRMPETEGIWKSLDSGSQDHFRNLLVKPGAPNIG